jgi:hypothetical protein
MQLDPEKLVQQIYQGLLGREADPGGLERYSQLVTTRGGITVYLQALVASKEFAYRYEIQKINSSFNKEDLEKEKIVFLHLPKTGGTTLYHLLAEGRSSEEICPERYNKLHSLTAGQLVGYQFFAGHFDYPSTQLIPGCKALITMFRNPIARLVSLYHFQKAHQTEIIERDNLHLARLASSYKMIDFFQHEKIRNHPSINNAMTRMLSTRVHSTRWEHQVSANHPNIKPNLKVALEILENMRAFGIFEHYEQSVRWIFKSLKIPIPESIPHHMAFDTITQTDPGLRKIVKEPLTANTLRVIEDLVSLDLQLYDRAKEIFSDSCLTLD